VIAFLKDGKLESASEREDEFCKFTVLFCLSSFLSFLTPLLHTFALLSLKQQQSCLFSANFWKDVFHFSVPKNIYYYL